MTTNWMDPSDGADTFAFAFVATILVGMTLLAVYTLQFPAVASLLPGDAELTPVQSRLSFTMGMVLVLFGLVGYAASAGLSRYLEGE